MQRDTRPEVDAQALAAAREAGASSLLTRIAAIDPDAVGLDQNPVARKLARAVVEGDAEAARSGGFMTVMWDGNLAEALYRADARNSRLLMRTLPRDEMLSALIADKGSLEKARCWLDPYLERYGWDDN